MWRVLVLFVALSLGVVANARAQVAVVEPNEVAEPNYESDDNSTYSGSNVLRAILLYVPNRVLDLLDIFRARAKFGPGFAISLRATESASFHAGTYTVFYAGLPGPRMEPRVISPIGIETSDDVDVNVAQEPIIGKLGPEYSPSEIGIGLQLAPVGVDVSFDPVELVDFVGGLFFFDLREDDF